AQLRGHRQLVTADPSVETLPPHTPPTWAGGTPSSPLSTSTEFPVTSVLIECYTSSTRCMHVAVYPSTRASRIGPMLEGVCQVNCVSGDSCMMHQFKPHRAPADPTSLKPAMVQGVCAGGKIYAAIGGSLFCVDIQPRRQDSTVTDTGLSCLDTPRVTRDEMSLILSTPTGPRVYPLPECQRVGALPLIQTASGRLVGECASGACLQGVAGTEDGYYRVQDCLWTPIEDEDESKEDTPMDTPSRVEIQTLERLLDVLRGGTSDSVVVKGLRLDAALAGNTCHDWTFEDCHFSSLVRSRLSQCTFHKCSLETADLSGCIISKCKFMDCPLSHASLEKATLTDTQMQ
ncbi:hypothetical protein KIPB_013990, partial [Kipferlia bialata]